LDASDVLALGVGLGSAGVVMFTAGLLATAPLPPAELGLGEGVVTGLGLSAAVEEGLELGLGLGLGLGGGGGIFSQHNSTDSSLV
jgi:hypothetical protein